MSSAALAGSIIGGWVLAALIVAVAYVYVATRRRATPYEAQLLEGRTTPRGDVLEHEARVRVWVPELRVLVLVHLAGKRGPTEEHLRHGLRWCLLDVHVGGYDEGPIDAVEAANLDLYSVLVSATRVADRVRWLPSAA